LARPGGNASGCSNVGSFTSLAGDPLGSERVGELIDAVDRLDTLADAWTSARCAAWR
jgi:hypothetical protein